MNALLTRPEKKFLNSLAAIVGPEGYSLLERDRLSYSRDANFRSAIQAHFGFVAQKPFCIVWPKSTSELASVIKLTNQTQFSIVPYGGGSGVCGGALPEGLAVTIDMKRLSKIHGLDEKRLVVDADAGVYGLHLENWLARQGYTLGHFPSSIAVATLGGYLATRSAGQLSNKYGKIEDMVLDLEFVDGLGRLHQTSDVSRQSGIDFTQALVGSEGTLGLITRARMKVFPKPLARDLAAFQFPSFAAGQEALRRILQSGLKPDVLRLYDPADSLLVVGEMSPASTFTPLLRKLKNKTLPFLLRSPQILNAGFAAASQKSLLITMIEGDVALMERDRKLLRDVIEICGGEPMPRHIAENWLEHRYSVAFKASLLFQQGCFTDTIEVAASWEKLNKVYQAVRDALSDKALVLAHASHVYVDGAALYFTIVGRLSTLRSSLKLYDAIWESILSATQNTGGTISHHHGIGRHKAAHLRKEWGPYREVYNSLKNIFDPQHTLNPGVLLAQGEPA